MENKSRLIPSALDKLFPETTDRSTRNLLIRNILSLEELSVTGFSGLFRSNNNKPVFEYISKSVEETLGYPVENFLNATTTGSFVFSKITPESMPVIFKKQAFYHQRAIEDGFDTSETNIMEFHASMIHSSGKIMPGFAISIALNYLDDRSIDLYLSRWFFPEAEITTQMVEDIKERISKTYKKIKKLFVKLYPHLFLNQNKSVEDSLLNLFYLNPSNIVTTSREKQVLLGLAKGMNSTALAQQLNISTHTVESHRKNLTKKFNVKNTAEMIKEAGKLYWLDDVDSTTAKKIDEAWPVKKITKQEKLVLLEFSKGSTTKEVSALLSISTNTVEYHRKNLLEKFEAKNVAELIKKASHQFWL